MPGKVRRIVTAVNAAGRSYILSDTSLPAAPVAPGEPVRAGLWVTESAPASNEGVRDPVPDGVIFRIPPVHRGGTVLRVVEFVPDSVQRADPKELARRGVKTTPDRSAKDPGFAPEVAQRVAQPLAHVQGSDLDAVQGWLGLEELGRVRDPVDDDVDAAVPRHVPRLGYFQTHDGDAVGADARVAQQEELLPAERLVAARRAGGPGGAGQYRGDDQRDKNASRKMPMKLGLPGSGRHRESFPRMSCSRVTARRPSSVAVSVPVWYAT